MERTVHPLLSLVEDNRNGLKSVLTHHIDATVDYQFDLLKNTILRMINHGLIDPLYEHNENDDTHFTWTDEQITLSSTSLTNSIYTEQVRKRGFDDEVDGEDDNDNEDIVDYKDCVNEIGNSVCGNYDNTSDDELICETQANEDASLENNQINSPIIQDEQKDDDDIDEMTVNTDNLQANVSDLHIRRSKSNEQISNNKTRLLTRTRGRTIGNTRPFNNLDSKQSIPSSSGLRSSGRRRIPTKFFGESNSDSNDRTSVKRASDQSKKAVKMVKLQSDDENDDDDDNNDVDQLKRKVTILELHCIEPACGQVLPSRSSWAKHMLNVHQRNLYDRYHHLENNVRQNKFNNQTEYFCTDCDDVHKSLTKKSLREHWRRYHQPGKFKCPLCHFEANLFNKVLAHQNKRHHSHECTHCSKMFAKSCEWKVHLRVHTDERPFECTFDNCGLKFKNIGHVVRHVRVVHFNIPKTVKEQIEKNIFDLREPHEYIRNSLL